MADHDALRHSRHALLNGFDEEGVQAVRAARALVIGAGGLGCPAATYLVSSGIGTLHWMDGDQVDATNLARQTLFGPTDIGQPKVQAGAAALQRLNPACHIVGEAVFADAAVLDRAVPLADVVLDCTDQWNVRQMINAACVRHGVPLVSAAAIEWSGQLIRMDPRDPEQACYACIFDPQTEPAANACGAYGVLAPMVGAMGCLQAAEAIKTLIGKKGPQMLWLLDGLLGSWQQLLVSKNPQCPVCAGRKSD